MSNSSARVGDFAEIVAPGWQARQRKAWEDSMPPCPTCGKKMGPIAGWHGFRKPRISCQDITCKHMLVGHKPTDW